MESKYGFDWEGVSVERVTKIMKNGMPNIWVLRVVSPNKKAVELNITKSKIRVKHIKKFQPLCWDEYD